MDDAKQRWFDRVEAVVLEAVEVVQRDYGRNEMPSDVLAREVTGRLWEALGQDANGGDDARWVKAVRGALGLSQYALARRLGCTQKSVTRWEAGKARPAPVFRAALERLTDLAG